MKSFKKVLPILGLTSIAAITPIFSSCASNKTTSLKWDIADEYEFKVEPKEYTEYKTNEELTNGYFEDINNNYLILAEDILCGMLFNIEQAQAGSEQQFYTWAVDMTQTSQICLTINNINKKDNRVDLDFEYKTFYGTKPNKYHNIFHFHNFNLVMVPTSGEGKQLVTPASNLDIYGNPEEVLRDALIADEEWSLEAEITTISKSTQYTQYYNLDADIAQKKSLSDLAFFLDKIIFTFYWYSTYFHRTVVR